MEFSSGKYRNDKAIEARLKSRLAPAHAVILAAERSVLLDGLCGSMSPIYGQAGKTRRDPGASPVSRKA